MKVSILDQDPERKRELAMLFADAVKHADIAEVFNVHIDTIGEWKKRADVQSLITKIIADRANNILSHTDTAILKRLEQAREPGGKGISMETLLRVRQTFAGEKVALDIKGDASTAMRELMMQLHDHPELAALLGEANSDADG